MSEQSHLARTGADTSATPPSAAPLRKSLAGCANTPSRCHRVENGLRVARSSASQGPLSAIRQGNRLARLAEWRRPCQRPPTVAAAS